MDASDSPKPRLPGELTFALAMLLLGLTAFWLSYRIAGFSSWSSAGSVPLGTTFFMCASAVVFIFGTLRKPPGHATPDNTVPRQFFDKIFPVRHILFTVVIVGYMVALEPLVATMDAMLADTAAYAAHKTHQGAVPNG